MLLYVRDTIDLRKFIDNTKDHFLVQLNINLTDKFHGVSSVFIRVIRTFIYYVFHVAK